MTDLETIRTSDLRLARWLLWARLWLDLALSLVTSAPLWDSLKAWGDPLLRAQLRRLRQLIARTLWIQAFRMASPSPFADKRYGPRKARPSAMRAIIGSRLRRLLRGKSTLDQLRALLRVLNNAEAERARLVRRLARGVTRLRTQAIARAHAILFTDRCIVAPTAALDSS